MTTSKLVDAPWAWRYVSGVLKDAVGTEYAVHVATFCVDGHTATHASVRTRAGLFAVSETTDSGDVSPSSVTFSGATLGVALDLFDCRPVHVSPPDRESSKTHACAPDVACSGALTLDGSPVEVSGSIWYDCEELSSGRSPGWDWASIRLDNGLRLYVYALEGSKGYAVSLDGAGVTRYEDVSVVARGSTLSHTARVYATRIEVDVKGFGKFFLSPWFDDQEVPSSIVPYYEAACDVIEDGHRVGTAFVEYVGRRPETEETLLLRWCCGDAEAAVAMRELAHGSQLADDFVDKDSKEFHDKSGHMLDFISFALGRLPNNRFYQKYRATIEPLVLMSSFYWDLSNSLVTLKDANSRYYAYAYREMLEQVLGMAAYILGGLEHARRTLREVHRFYHVINVDAFDAWWAEVSN